MPMMSSYPSAPSLLVADEPPPSAPSPAPSDPPEPAKKPHPSTKHGLCGTPTYQSWRAMIRRCRNPKNNRYALYGGRGITICDRWLGADGFANFVADLGVKPSPVHTLDRADTNANYAPGNVRWATPTEQARNRRTSRRFTVGELSLTAAEWAERSGISANAIYLRIVRRGWTPEEAVTTPTGVKRTTTKIPEPLPRERQALTAGAS